EIRHTDGPICGIIHGAGYGKPSPFEMTNLKAYQRTVSPKIDGAVALMALTQRDPVQYFVGFGSISGRFGGNGLTAYAVANDMLAKLIAWRRQAQPGSYSCCLHWQTWDEIGMVTLSDGVEINKNVLKMEYIPPSEGVEHLEAEVRAGLPHAEVVITDGFFQ